MDGFFFDPDWINNKPDPNKHQKIGVLEILTLGFCILVTLGIVQLFMMLFV